MMREMETYGDAEGLVEGTAGLYEGIAGLGEEEILGIAPSNSPPMHLVYHNNRAAERRGCRRGGWAQVTPLCQLNREGK